MMSRTFGAPLGGTTRGAHQGVESLALSLITPPNVGGNGGSCFPSSEVVALGEPSVPVIFGSSNLFSLCSELLCDFCTEGLRRKSATNFHSCMKLTLCFFKNSRPRIT